MDNLYYTVDCTDKTQQDLIDRAVGFALRSLMPRIRSLDIQVEVVDFNKPEIDECGYCTRESNRHFIFEVANNLEEESLVRTILHEMVHVKQYVYQELKQIHTKKMGVQTHWKGEDYTNTTYSEQPWEIEAYDLEERLYNEFCNNRS